MEWRVPYSARDAAGNAAMTVYRDLIVREYTLDEYLAKAKDQDKKVIATHRVHAVVKARINSVCSCASLTISPSCQIQTSCCFHHRLGLREPCGSGKGFC